MRAIILISGDRKTHDEIKALLPKGATLEEFTSLDELPRPRTLSAEGRYSEAILLIDLTCESMTAGRIEPFRLAGIPLVALIGSPDQREAAFRDGFDDYLLRPISPAELKNRLERLAPTGAAAPQIPSAVLERERQAAVGRLTSYFCHAVNNSMQTIRGAIDLAREEPDLSPEVGEYLAICRKETERIGIKINRLRQIYRPDPSPPEAVRLETLVRESLRMATDELLRNNISVKEQIGDSLPVIHGSADRISLALLMILFYLSEELGARGGGELRVQVAQDRGAALVSLTTASGSGAPGADSSEILPPGLEPAGDLIRSERGRLEALPAGEEYGLQIRFPEEGESADQ
jgi:signal transduction histidine kinase